MIEGVQVKTLRIIPDERGRLMEILRRDDDLFEKFGQVYLTTGYPGIVKAWHYHKNQTDYFAVVAGMMKVALYDSREDSPTQGEVNEFYMGIHNPILLKIPPWVYHGFKAVGNQEALLINIPTEVYNTEHPDEFRIDPYNNDIPYSWEVKEG